jgi:hypothetical protein
LLSNETSHALVVPRQGLEPWELSVWGGGVGIYWTDAEPLSLRGGTVSAQIEIDVRAPFMVLERVFVL